VTNQLRTTRRNEEVETLVDAVAQSVGFMGPVFVMAFLVPLLVGLNAAGKGAGAAAPLSVLIAGVGVLGLGWIVAEYARRIQAAGSLTTTSPTVWGPASAAPPACCTTSASSFSAPCCSS
jgi:amino acid transporter